MPINTPIAGIPVPTMSEKPNGPDQMDAIARAVERRLVNPFANANARAKAWASPHAGATSYLTNLKRHEVYDGSKWLPVGRNAGNIASAGVYYDTDRYIVPAATPAIAGISVKVSNPHPSATMHWIAFRYAWTSIFVNKGAVHVRFHQNVSVNGSVPSQAASPSMLLGPSAANHVWSGQLSVPLRGTVAPGGSTTIAANLQLQRAMTPPVSDASALMTAAACYLYVISYTVEP